MLTVVSPVQSSIRAARQNKPFFYLICFDLQTLIICTTMSACEAKWASVWALAATDRLFSQPPSFSEGNVSAVLCENVFFVETNRIRQI